MNPTAITMEDGVYLFGGTVPPEDNPNFSKFLAKGSQTWTKGPKVPHIDFDGICGVKISEHELVLIGGEYNAQSNHHIFKFDTRTQQFERVGKLQESRFVHAYTVNTGYK